MQMNEWAPTVVLLFTGGVESAGRGLELAALVALPD